MSSRLVTREAYRQPLLKTGWANGILFVESFRAVLTMAVAKAKATIKRSEEDNRYRQVMADLDAIFEQGRKEAAHHEGVSFREYIKETRMRLGAKE